MSENEFTDEQLIVNWENITIANDIMFYLVMMDDELLLELVRRILPELNIDHIKSYAQKQLEVGADIRGVRFDIFLLDDADRAITVEMQIRNYEYLPKRMRYYVSIGDTAILEKGESYENLPETYVIMICPFDYYDRGLHKYTFRHVCREQDDLEIDDGVTCIVLNAKGTADDVDEKLKAVLDYIAGKKSDDEYVGRLEKAVMHGRLNKEWRRYYMTQEQRDLESRSIGRREGIEQGEEQLVNVISKLKSGKTSSELIASGVNARTVERAMKCI